VTEDVEKLTDSFAVSKIPLVLKEKRPADAGLLLGFWHWQAASYLMSLLLPLSVCLRSVDVVNPTDSRQLNTPSHRAVD
jgi:hypothetical protein